MNQWRGSGRSSMLNLDCEHFQSRQQIEWLRWWRHMQEFPVWQSHFVPVSARLWGKQFLSFFCWARQPHEPSTLLYFYIFFLTVFNLAAAVLASCAECVWDVVNMSVLCTFFSFLFQFYLFFSFSQLSCKFWLYMPTRWLKYNFWLTWKMSICGKNYNAAIFSNTMNMINAKLSMMVVLIDLYPFIQLSVTLIVFQGHNSVKQF